MDSSTITIPDEILSGTTGVLDTARRRTENRIALEHLALADSIARRFAVGRDVEDLRQVAYVGLVKATRRFDASKGENFVSFAVPTISGEIKRYLRDQGWLIRPPRPLHDLRARMVLAAAELTQQLGHQPTAAELAAHLGESVASVLEAERSTDVLRPTSLDSPVGKEEGLTLADVVPADGAGLENSDSALEIGRALQRLTTRERLIVHLRFYRDWTQQEIATELGVTQMQVSRLLSKILSTLRESLSDASPRAA